jgi:hypothetical protein
MERVSQQRRNLVARQGQTYNRQNWAYKISDMAARALSGTGGIFATRNLAAFAELPTQGVAAEAGLTR